VRQGGFAAKFTVRPGDKFGTTSGERSEVLYTGADEHEGDDVYRRTLARLFSGEYEALEVLRWKDIVQAMEAAINTVEDISNIVESIILKHA